MPCGFLGNRLRRCPAQVSTRARASCLAAGRRVDRRPSAKVSTRARASCLAAFDPAQDWTGKCFNPCARVMPCGLAVSNPDPTDLFQPVRARHALRQSDRQFDMVVESFNPCARVMPCGLPLRLRSSQVVLFQPVRARHALRRAPQPTPAPNIIKFQPVRARHALRLGLLATIAPFCFNPCARVMPCGPLVTLSRAPFVSTRARASCLAANAAFDLLTLIKFQPVRARHALRPKKLGKPSITCLNPCARAEVFSSNETTRCA